MTRPAEVTAVHTNILRLTLGLEYSRAYWAHVDPDVPVEKRAAAAFEQRWFGTRSMARARLLIRYLSYRYDAYPSALELLQRWRDMDPTTRILICHWHLQLSDPLYRAFTGELLPERRDSGRATIDLDLAAHWVKDRFPDRWGPNTVRNFASKLLTAASEAGLVAPGKEPRALRLPRVPDAALGYLLYLLREVSIDGSPLSNPYLASVGLTDAFLHDRLRTLPGVRHHRMSHLEELEWDAPDLRTWAERAGLIPAPPLASGM